MKKPFAITLDVGTSLENRTGSWRTLRPTYVHKLPPCNHQCPAGEDIQGWLFYAESGNYEKAWRHLTKRNPLPSCMGRVCYHIRCRYILGKPYRLVENASTDLCPQASSLQPSVPCR